MAAGPGTKEVNKDLILLTVFLECLGPLRGEEGWQGLTMGIDYQNC